MNNFYCAMQDQFLCFSLNIAQSNVNIDCHDKHIIVSVFNLNKTLNTVKYRIKVIHYVIFF
jgi:hypothetical protein